MSATDAPATGPREAARAARMADSLTASNALLEAQNAALRSLLDQRDAAERRRSRMLRASQALVGADAEDQVLDVLSRTAIAMAGATRADVRLEPPLAGHDLAWHDADVLVAPLRAGAEPLGELRLHGATRPLAPDVADDLLNLASQAGAAVARARALRDARRQAGIAHAILNAAPDPIVMVDDTGRVIAANARYLAAQESLGPVHAGHAAPECLAGIADPEAYARELEGLQHDPDAAGTFEYAYGTPARVVVRDTAPVVDATGARLGRVFVHRDVTAERRALQAREDFLALVSHELRTPLTSVVGYLELLADGEAGSLEPEQGRVVGVARANAARLQRMVGDLLTVAQAHAGAMTLVSRRHDVTRCARHAVDSALPAARARGITVHPPQSGPVRAVVDAERLGQVLDNLLGNAIAYGDPGGSVAVDVAGAADEVVISVTDTGPGIPTDERPHVFEHFYRGARGAGRHGTGLGLAISRTIVEAHGGRIELDAPGARGARFRVCLPRGHRHAERITFAPPVRVGAV